MQQYKKQERKVYPMKMKHFIPAVALAITVAVPAFAAPVTTQSDTLQFTLSPFFNITKNTPKTYTGAVSVDDAYTTLTVTTPMTFGYHVITNNRSDAVKLTAKAESTSGTQVDALGGTASNPIVVFTNTTMPAAEKPSKAQVQNAAALDAEKSNTPNAIAFNVVPVCKMVDNTGAAADPAATMTSAAADGANIKYTFNNGEYNFDYTISTADNTTFSTYDTEGTYKAFITMTQVAPQ